MSGDTILNGRYKLVAQQGSGGMAVIYKAVDLALGRTVAVKILRPSLTTDPAFIARFQNEARSIANLSHPNIVTVHDVGSEGPTNYMVMEFIEGQDLKKIIRDHGALPLDRVLNISISICAGLGFAHRAGIVHADVKPQNILITKDDIVKITDFGIAQALSDTQPQQRQSVVWGSPHYFSPEQAQGEKPTAAADVYSIGIVMFEMLTGRLPFTGTNQQELAMAHIRERIPLVTEFNPAVPETLARIIEKAMGKLPSDRHRTADQLGHILISLRDRGRGQTITAQAVPDSPAVPPQAQQPHRQMPVQQTPPPPSTSRPIDPSQGYPRPQQPAQPGYLYGGQYNQPGQEPLPTQRYSAAPDAPGSLSRPASPPSDSKPFMTQPYSSPQGLRQDSRPLAPRYPYNQEMREEPRPTGLDGVTIALAVLAFMAVACLIPLYIAVLQARLG